MKYSVCCCWVWLQINEKKQFGKDLWLKPKNGLCLDCYDQAGRCWEWIESRRCHGDLQILEPSDLESYSFVSFRRHSNEVNHSWGGDSRSKFVNQLHAADLQWRLVRVTQSKEEPDLILAENQELLRSWQTSMTAVLLAIRLDDQAGMNWRHMLVSLYKRQR